MSYKILVINPGSTSTKLALYVDENKIFEKNLDHTVKELQGFGDVLDQLEYRYELIEAVLRDENVDINTLSTVIGRGGMLPNMKAGGYKINQAMKDTICSGLASPHASNLGAILASRIADPLGIPSYIYDSVTSDEYEDIAKITGVPEIQRQSMCHVLNMKAVSRKVAKKYGKTYEEMRLLVAHLGGGISISVHENGKIIDSIRDDAGPFAPERSGSIPLFYVVDLCYSGEYNKKEMIKKIRGNGGMKALLGTQDCREIEVMIANGDERAKLIYEAEAYQIAKGIGEMAPVLSGKIDCIILTGGMAYSKMMIDMVSERISFIAPIEIFPGGDEMEALALGALRLLQGKEVAKEYVHP